MGCHPSQGNHPSQPDDAFKLSLRTIRELRGRYKVLAIQRNDDKTFFDKHLPRVARDWTMYYPNDVWIGDVTPLDIRCLRDNGNEVYVRAIGWYDIATHRLMFVLFKAEPGEAVKRWQVAQAFIAAVTAWGLPKRLYLDNGSEYKWETFLNAYNDLAQLGHKVAVGLGIPSHILEAAEDNVIRAMPYNAPAKPIEGAFSVFNKLLSMMPGYVGGDRTNKLTKKKGKEPHTFKGSFDEFHSMVATGLATYHKLPQRGQLQGKSPVHVFNAFVESGWQAIGLEPRDLVLALAEEDTRRVTQGMVRYKPKDTPKFIEVAYHHPDLLALSGQSVNIRALASHPEYIFVLIPGAGWKAASVWQGEDGLSARNVERLLESKRHLRRLISERRGEVYRLDLVEEMESWNQSQPDFKETPVAAVLAAAQEIQGMKQALLEHQQAPALPKPSGTIDRFGAVEDEFEWS
jgi:hypothetical protein